ncbi:MAG TPA: bifunctional DNA-formamidopyrimidine glycosylase/DNA-(apurinic or apyrimidinic site) lyase [Anaerolineae bacterium]|jgi:formamidopyrimidine-DNA glycosylase|nr:bifunctional DNA-formamidopyrimidine glycosylase/DNA-(apurinic or apyrimidinic site) lyase [Anaerolineae bacterium]
MPELPETETIRRELGQSVVGLKIVDVEVPVSRILRMPADEFIRRVKGTVVAGANRRAKIIVLHLSSGEALLFHLMMAGSLLYMPAGIPRGKATQVIFILENGYELRYRDLRLFGYVKLLGEGDVLESPELRHLGPEPLSDEFTPTTLKEMLAKRPRGKVKALLLDQTFIAGIGNIYADEILFYAGVHPARPAGSLTNREIERIYEGVRSILAKAIEERGSSIASYVDLYGSKGNYTNFLKVYNRTGEPCPDGCTGVIVKIKVAGRGTHVCPDCQK